MSDYKHKNGTGSLFFNEKKHDKQPDLRGTIVTPDGQEFKISAWKRAGNKGEYFSVAIDQYEKQQTEPASSTGGNNLPF